MNRLPSGPLHVALALFVAGLLSNPALGRSHEHNDPSLEQALQVVDSLRTVGDFRTALARLYDLNREYPGTWEVLWRYAIIWSDYGKAADNKRQASSAYRQALTMADRALAADPGSPRAHLAKAAAAGRAALMAESNKRSVQLSREVKDHADRAIELDSTMAPAYHIRGVWHSEVADLNFVTRTIVRAMYGGLPEASLEQAEADLKRATDLETHAYNHLELGKVYLKMERPDAAREQLQLALDAPPNDPFAPKDKLEARRLLSELN
jgi:tetratricopeptide (TPR) repeat protein